MANDLNIVYKIAADISGLQDGVKRAAKATEGLETVAKSVGAALAGMFTVQAAIGFAKTLIADADALQKLSDKTGVSLQGLQKFQIAADDAGNSIDQLTSAIAKMEDKLVSGDKSALAALNKLGIPFEDIKNLNPENQFIAISDALRQIHDPAQQVAIAIDLFGKTGAEVLPTLKRGFDDLKESAVGMSDETVQALDEAGDTLDRWWRKGKGILAEAFVATVHLAQDGFTPMGHAIGNAVREAEALNKQLTDMANKVPAAGKNLPAPLSVPTSNSADVRAFLRDSEEALKRQQQAQREAAQETERAARIQEEFRQSVEQATIAANLSTFTLHRWGAVTLPAATQGVKGLDLTIDHLESTTLPDLKIRLQDVGGTAVQVFERAKTVAETIHGAFKDALATLPKTLVNAFTGGGGLLGAAKALGVQLADAIVTPLLTRLSALKKGAVGIGASGASALGVATAGQAGAIAGGLASSIGGAAIAGHVGAGVAGSIALGAATFGIGAAAVGIALLIKHHNALQKEVNKTREAFVQAAGGLDLLNQRAHDAGVTLDHLLDARTPEAYKKAIEELNDAFQFQADSMQFLDDTIEKYGISISELGPRLSQQRLTQQAFQIEKEFRALEAAGIDVETISTHMKDAINEYLHAALQTGSAVPESMREILHQLAEMGLLTDENGNAITDLEAAGIHFSQTLDEQFQDLIQTINKLIDAISRGLGNAIENIPQPDPVHVPVVYDPTSPFPSAPTGTDPIFGATGGVVPQYFAGGGRVLAFRPRGVDTVPTMLSPGELILNRAQQRNLAGTLADEMRPLDLHNYIYLDGHQIAENFVRHQIKHDKRGLKTALKKELGL